MRFNLKKNSLSPCCSGTLHIDSGNVGTRTVPELSGPKRSRSSLKGSKSERKSNKRDRGSSKSGRQDEGGASIGGRDNSLFLFRALGKILYAKRKCVLTCMT